MKTVTIRLLGLVPWTVSTIGAAGAVLGFVTVLSSPIPVYAGHAGAADCPHTHVDGGTSFCNKGVAGKRKCGEDKKSICQDVKTEVFGVDVPSCLCLAKEDEIPSEVITRMMDATRVGLEFPTTYPTLISSLGTSGAMAACSQFQTAIQDIVSDKDTLNALEMRIYHPEFLDKIDSIINNLPTIASLAISYFSPCSSVSVTLPTVPVSAVLGILVDKKVELIDNRDLLYE